MEWPAQMRSAWLERTLARLDSVARRRGRAASLPAHLATGISGEEAALFYLRRSGYTVVARRWSSGDRPGDVDLIAWQGPMLCFVEVKTRTARDAAPAEIAIDAHKRFTLRRLGASNTSASCPRQPRRRSASMCSASILCPAKKGIRPL
jgi:putative endonuclease